MSTLTELVTKFKFEGSSKPLADYSEKLQKSLKGLTAFTGAVVAATAAMIAWVSPILDAVDALGNLGADLKTPIARIQELDYIATMSNSSTEDLRASLQGLSKTAALAANDMGLGRAVFKELGINVKDSNGKLKNSADLLNEIRQRMNKLNMTADERSAFAQKLGMSPSMLQLLQRTDDEMASLAATARELGIVTQEQADAAAAYNDSVDTLKFGLNALRQFTATALAPSLKELVDTFTELLVNNRDWIVKGIKVTVGVLADFIQMVIRLMPILIAVGVAFIALKIYTLGFAAAMGVLFSPVVLITAAILALMVIVDDLIVAFKGGDSVIGNFFKNTLNIDLSKTLDQLKAMWDWVVKLTKAVTGSFANAWGKLKGVFGGGDTTSPNQSMLVTGGRGGVSNMTDNRKVEQDVKIEIKTDDPVRAGNAAADSIQRQLRDGNAQLGVGGM